ncbi:MAG: hypothetical protein M1837_004986 [Sclerophora amabilis]|nr:MAG: hypothetical protein M1837_004986 [Sclerophora amabilis]
MASQVVLKNDRDQSFVTALKPGAARVRLEIDEFLYDNDRTNLFLLALAEMQKEDPTKKSADNTEDWWTFYSLSSIHGLPPELWNNVPNLNEGKGKVAGSGRGYCTHGSLVFPTWHRVYVLMFEQAVAEKMMSIAGKYGEDEKQKYETAAAQFRLPYWDPIMPRNPTKKSGKLDEKIFGVPKILSQKRVFVNHWDKSKPKDIENPLQQFSFPKEDVLREKGRTTWTEKDWRGRVVANGRDHTLRTPGIDGETNYDGDYVHKNNEEQRREGYNLKLQRQAQVMGAKLWKLLSSYEWTEQDMAKPRRDPDPHPHPEEPFQGNWQDQAHRNNLRSWHSFASHRLNPGSYDSSISLETWHDDIHDLLGTGRSPGHMADPAIASFDPIFWLHHCNIDRLFAIYQALYPDEGDDQGQPKDSSKWVPESGTVKSPENSKMSLYPFRKNDKNFWTSNDVKDWRTLGFAIPGHEKLDKKGREDLETYLRKNYYWATELDYPPESVAKKWPKNLDHSFALYGHEAKAIDRPVSQHEALEQSRLVTRSTSLATQETPQPVDKEITVTFVDASGNKKLYPDGSLQSGTGKKAMRTWSAQVLVKKFAFNGSFNVHIFIGDIKGDQAERYFTKKNEVGFSGIFASDRSAPCANCLQQREDGMVYQDAIPLTMAMTKYLTSNTDPDGPDPDRRTLQSFEPEHVVPFLRQHMHWVITTPASDVIDAPEKIRDSQLEISVWDSIFDLPTPDRHLGSYHPANLHQEITETQPGGLGYTYT